MLSFSTLNHLVLLSQLLNHLLLLSLTESLLHTVHDIRYMEEEGNGPEVNLHNIRLLAIDKLKLGGGGGAN